MWPCSWGGGGSGTRGVGWESCELPGELGLGCIVANLALLREGASETCARRYDHHACVTNIVYTYILLCREWS
jgi:hypothetical protein